MDKELIMSRFPSSAEGFGGSLAYKILSHLSLFFLLAQSVPSLHQNHHGLVKEAPELLTALASRVLVGPEPDPGTLSVKKGKATSQKKLKIARRVAAQNKNAPDPTPFQHLNISIPETPEEVEKSIEIVLVTQRSILEVSNKFIFI